MISPRFLEIKARSRQRRRSGSLRRDSLRRRRNEAGRFVYELAGLHTNFACPIFPLSSIIRRLPSTAVLPWEERMFPMTVTVRQLAELVGGRIEGDGELVIH